MALLEHPSQYARAKGLQTFNIPQDYYSFFNTFPINNNFAIFTPIYHQFVDMFVSEFFAQQVINATPNYDMQGYYADRYEFAKKFLQGEALNFALTKSVVDGATRGSVEKVLDKYEDFKKTNTRNEYLQVFELLRKQFTPISAGQVAPDFTAYDLNGQPIKLSSLKGKVVYIDFWATWCGPCRQQFPAERELHKKFEGNKDVVFLLVSTDSKPEPWKAFLDKEKLPGTNVWAGDQYAAVANTYNITGIPRFMLIDKQGKIFSSNARRPADTRIEADIRALLQ
jgi:thiol-disulfide isomerase/thioredoxin